MTIQTTLTATDDIAVDAVTTTFFQQSLTPAAIEGDYFDEESTLPEKLSQVTSLVGDGFDYLITLDTIYDLTAVTAGGDTVQLNTVHNILNATKAQIIGAQDEADYEGTGDNGTFFGGSGFSVSDSITLDDGTGLTVDAVSSGVITQFTINTAGLGTNYASLTRRQVGTSGSGIECTLFPGNNNMVDGPNAVPATATIPSFTLVDGGNLESFRSIFQVTLTLTDGEQFNLGTLNSKTRDSNGSQSLSGNTIENTISYLKVKR
jgi:hypothetical protein